MIFRSIIQEVKKLNEFFVNGYGDVLKKYPNIWEFLVNKGAHRIERVESIWRKENIILKIYSGDKNYVFKRINDPKAREEIERFREIKMAYPELYPDAFFF
jgi:hypothetical protein